MTTNSLLVIRSMRMGERMIKNHVQSFTDDPKMIKMYLRTNNLCNFAKWNLISDLKLTGLKSAKNLEWSCPRNLSALSFRSRSFRREAFWSVVDVVKEGIASQVDVVKEGIAAAASPIC